MKKKKHSFKKTVKKFIHKKPTTRKRRKLYLYVIIVNFGIGDRVIDILQEANSNLQFLSVGKGTASKEILRIVGLEDERKDVVLGFVNEKELKYLKQDLDQLFLQKKRFMGMGFTIQVSSVVGEKVYKFLTNTI